MNQTPLLHAVAWLGHHSAQLIPFGADQVLPHKLKVHEHPTRQHGCPVRSAHGFFGGLRQAPAGTRALLVTGPEALRHWPLLASAAPRQAWPALTFKRQACSSGSV